LRRRHGHPRARGCREVHSVVRRAPGGHPGAPGGALRGLSTEELELRSDDGTPLAALAWGGVSGPGVVIVHGLGSVKENHADFAERLGASGLRALALDLRGHGASAGEPGPGMVDDVLAAVRRLAEGGPVGIRGSSLGAFLALHAAARDPAV